jgi:hypothetical protein
MKIERNKYLTNIIGSNIRLALPTEKYDDIVGISNNVLPEPMSECNGEDSVIEFNGKKIQIRDIYEFSDMNGQLYTESISNAAVKYETEGAIQDRTKIKLDLLLIQLAMPNISGVEAHMRARSYKLRDTLLMTSKNTYISKSSQNVLEHNSEVWASCDKKDLLDEKRLNDLAKSIVLYYQKIIFTQTFFDKNGNTYKFPILKIEEVIELIRKCLAMNIYKSDFLSKSTYKINIFSDILIKTNTWKRFGSGILTMMKNGSETLVDITDLIEQNVYLEMKKQGRSCLELKRFSKIPY